MTGAVSVAVLVAMIASVCELNIFTLAQNDATSTSTVEPKRTPPTKVSADVSRDGN